MHIIVGTAGHIDHGKTTLIKALTGTDTDRLPEEKKRGITIDLGFAELDLGDHSIGFVDVPGHERFVKNMLAGASGIDLVLLIVAADEGVMPQTREHFDICRLLGIQNGLVVVTKKDMVDEELLDLVRLDVAELAEGSFLEDAPVIAVSSTDGEGLDELREAIAMAANLVGVRRDDQVTRFPIDRSFVIKGFGTVVTGTLASGEIREGDELELLPDQRKVRVRGLQTHGKPTAIAVAGQRVAVNLAGIDHTEVVRGMTLSKPGTLEPTRVIDAHVEVLKDAPKPLRSRQRVRIHIGTAEALARVQVIEEEAEILPGTSGYVQLRLEVPVTAMMGEHFIIRTYSPQTTIAGGIMIDPMPPKHRARDSAAVRGSLENLRAAAGDHRAMTAFLVEAAGERGVEINGLQVRTGWKTGVIREALAANVAAGAVIAAEAFWLAARTFEDLKLRAVEAVEAHHTTDRLSKGIPRDLLRDKAFRKVPPGIFRAVIAELERENKLITAQDLVKLASYSQQLSPAEAAFLNHVEKELLAAGLSPPKIDEVLASADQAIPAAQAKKLLAATGVMVRVSDEFIFARASIDDLTGLLHERAESFPNRLIDVPTFKELAGVSRKYAIPLLEYFDRVGITKRAGDKRIIV